MAVSALLSGTGTLFANGYQIGDLYYTLNSTEKTATVTYSNRNGAPPSAYETNYRDLKSAIIPSTITLGGDVYTVTAIGERAFYQALVLREVTLPETIVTIGESAFYGTSITAIDIPESVTTIESSAFSGTRITSIDIPESVTTIKGAVFENCTSLTRASIPDKTTVLLARMFSGCTALVEVVLPPALESIGNYCFDGCSNLKLDGLNIPTLTTIGEGAFRGRTSLSSTVVIPDGIEVLGNSAFKGCTGITEIILGSGLESLAYSVFEGCTGVKRLTVRPGDTPIDLQPYVRYEGFIHKHDGIFYEMPLEEVVLGREIVSHADVSGTNEVGLTNPFEEHPTLRRMIVGDNVRNIDKKLCRNCPNLEYVSLGKNVRSIGKNAFYLSTKIATIDAHMKIAPYLATADNVFSTQTYGADLNVPDGSSADYRTAEVWKNFKYLGVVTDDDAAADGAVWKIRVPKGHVINLFMVKDDAHMQNLSLATDNADVAHVERVVANPECHYIVPLAEGVAAITAYNADNKVVGRMQVEVSDDIQTGVPATSVRGYVPEIEADGLTVTVTGIEPGDNVAVFATDGRLVKYLQAESDRAVFRVGDDGTYLINVAGVTEKLYLYR